MPIVPIEGNVKYSKHQPYQIWLQINDINRENGIFSLFYADTVFSKLNCKRKSYCFPILLKINLFAAFPHFYRMVCISL